MGCCPSPMTRARAIALGVVIACTCLAGCAGPGSTDTTPGAESAGAAEASEAAPVEVSAYRSRDDDARGDRFQITVTNASAAPITLETVQFRSPGFAEVAASERELQMGPGARIDVPVGFGTADCAASVDPIEAVVSYHDDSGSVQTTTVPLAQPYDIIDRIHNEQCSAARIAGEVTMTLTVDPTVTPATDGGFPSRAATLVLQRVDGGPAETIRADEVAGSVVWGVVSDPSDPLPLTLAADASELRVPLRIAPTTCAPHIVGDAKKPFVFPIWLAFDDEPTEYTRIPVDDATRRDLSGFLESVCNTG